MLKVSSSDECGRVACLFLKNIMRIYYITLFKKYLFLYLLAVLCLIAMCGILSSCGERGLHLWFVGFSLQWLLLLRCTGSGAHRLQSLWCSGAQVPHDMWNPPGPGIEAVCSALADGLLTISCQGSPACLFLNSKFLEGGMLWCMHIRKSKQMKVQEGVWKSVCLRPFKSRGLLAVTGRSPAHGGNAVTKADEGFNQKVAGYTRFLLCCHQESFP